MIAIGLSCRGGVDIEGSRLSGSVGGSRWNGPIHAAPGDHLADQGYKRYGYGLAGLKASFQ